MESVKPGNRLTKYQKTSLLTVFLGDGSTLSVFERLFLHKYGRLDPGCWTKLEVFAALAMGFAIEQRDVLLRRKELDIPFNEFTKDTAGLVPDVKNDLNLVDS